MQLIKLDAIDSTNQYLSDLHSNVLLEDFAIVVADYQTDGRGQQGNRWYSEKGKNLIMSVLKKKIKINLDRQFNINMRVSLAVLSALRTYKIPDLSIKWPNDILSCNFKIAGILIQVIVQKNQIKSSIIGIGINVNQVNFENLPKAISMKNVLEKKIDLQRLRLKVTEQLKYFFKLSDQKVLMSLYEKELYKKGKISNFVDSDGISFDGTVQGITRAGKIKINTLSGLKIYDLKSIKFDY